MSSRRILNHVLDLKVYPLIIFISRQRTYGEVMISVVSVSHSVSSSVYGGREGGIPVHVTTRGHVHLGVVKIYLKCCTDHSKILLSSRGNKFLPGMIYFRHSFARIPSVFHILMLYNGIDRLLSGLH